MGLRVAITGGIACGKSLFSRLLVERGVPVLDADEVVHGLEAPGGAAVAGIRGAFGPGVIRPDGGVDRAALGERVFADPAARERLNRLVHPLVQAEIRAWLDAAPDRLRAVAIPLLFEVGWEQEWDVIVCVASDEATQLERLVRFRGLSVEQARMRLAAQMPVADKAARAHLVVNNNADVNALAERADQIVRLLTERSQ